MTFDSFFKGKRIFVTGHTGFKGSWLCHWLISLGAQVYGYSLGRPYPISCYSSISLDAKVKHSFVGDIADYDSLLAAVNIVNPNITFHLAAQSIVSESYNNPLSTYSSNVIGTLNLFEALRNTSNDGIAVFVTSDKCYENVETYYGYRETDPMGGHDPYSSSKACAEILLSSMARSYPNRRFVMATARAGNVIGGGDWSQSRIIPDCIRSWMTNKPVIIRSPKSTRPWQHVLEPLSGYLQLAYLLSSNYDLDSQSFNFGPTNGSVVTVEDVVSLMATKFTYSEFEIQPESSIGKEAGLLSLDISKAMNLLSWKPRLSSYQSIDLTASWYASYLSGTDAQLLHTNDLDFFLSR